MRVTQNDQESLKYALQFGPIATGICGTDESFISYQSGIFNKFDCCKELNHAVLIVGYGHDEQYNVGEC